MKEDSKGKTKKLDPAIKASVIILIFAAICIIYVWICPKRVPPGNLIIPIIGIVSFIIPLVLSLSPKYNLGTKLSKGEVRKSIVISFTVVYILLLSISFFQSTYEPTININNSSKTIVYEELNIAYEKLNITPNSSRETANVEQNNITPNSSIETTNVTTSFEISTEVPNEAIGNFIHNFLYVYIIIIGFYFGSRMAEKIGVLKQLGVNSLEIAQARYAMGDIDDETFKKIQIKLVTAPILRLKISATSDPKKITIKHERGNDIDLKNIRMIIKMNGKKTKVDTVARAGKEDVFEVTDNMVVHMEKIITPADDAITVNDNPTGVKKKDISVGIKEEEWKKDKEVEVTLVYKPLGEIISEEKVKIDS